MIKPFFKNILVAVNGSDRSIKAAKYAILMAKMYNCKVSVIYVVDTATIKYLTLSKFFIQEESAEYEKSLVQNGENNLKYVEELAASKGIKIEKIMRSGSIWGEIVAVAQEKYFDAILVGGLEHHPEDNETLSRQAKELIIHSPCSVIVVKEHDIDKLFKLA